MQQSRQLAYALVVVVALLFLQTSHWEFVVSATTPSPLLTPQKPSQGTVTTATLPGTASRNKTIVVHNDSRDDTIVLSKEYHVYIVITPFENTIGRAVAEELTKQLSELSPVPSEFSHTQQHEHPVTTTTSVVCLVRCPPLASHHNHSTSNENNTKSNNESYVLNDGNTKEMYPNKASLLVLPFKLLLFQPRQRLRKLANACRRCFVVNNTTKRSCDENQENNNSNLWLDRCSNISSSSSSLSPVLVLASSSGRGTRSSDVDNNACYDFSFDPFGDTSNTRESSKKCLNQIHMELFRRMAAEALLSKSDSSSSSAGNINPNNKDSSKYGEKGEGLLSATIYIRGILFNPYGCPPPPQKIVLEDTTTAGRSRNNGDDSKQSTTIPPTRPQRSLKLSPLAAYKLVSIAIFVEELVSSTRTSTTLKLPIRELPFLRDRESIPNTMDDGFEENQKSGSFEKTQASSSAAQPPLRIIVVGTEAARGLPQMGIPVPDLEGSTESSIRTKLFLDNDSPEGNAESSRWETEYAEMNALAVLYFKALEHAVSSHNPSVSKQVVNGLPATESTARAIPSSAKSDSRDRHRRRAPCYFGIVSPGMTPESLNIKHVPKPARTLAFRWKLWMCNRRWILEWLQKLEIAKPTEHAGALLVTALLNGPMDSNANTTTTMNYNYNYNHRFVDDTSGSSEDTQLTTPPKRTKGGHHRLLRWDDVYPSGSFVGAQSGTGGPLCEQSLLLYNATSNKVGRVVVDAVDTASGLTSSEAETDNLSLDQDRKIPTTETNHWNHHEEVNFLSNRRLQDLVYRVVREIIVG